MFFQKINQNNPPPNEAVAAARVQQREKVVYLSYDNLLGTRNREIKLSPNEDVLSLDNFINLFDSTYKADIEWAEKFTKENDALEARKAELELKFASGTINKDQLEALNSRLKVKLQLEKDKLISSSPHMQETLELNYKNKLGALEAEHKRLLELLDGDTLSVVSLGEEFLHAFQEKEREALAPHQATLSELEKLLSSSAPEVDKKRKLLKLYTVNVLRAYANTFAGQECRVSIFGRYHGEGLPFSNEKYKPLSRMQFIHLSAPNFSCLVDTGSLMGTVCKLKFRRELTEGEINEAVRQVNDATDISNTVTAEAQRSQVNVAMANATRDRLINFSRTVQQAYQNKSSNELDFSTQINVGLGILNLPNNGICCVKIGRENTRDLPYFQLEFNQGKLESVLALSDFEYRSDQVFELGLRTNQVLQQDEINQELFRNRTVHFR